MTTENISLSQEWITPSDLLSDSFTEGADRETGHVSGRVFDIMNDFDPYEDEGKKHELMRQYTFRNSGNIYGTKYVSQERHTSGSIAYMKHGLTSGADNLMFAGFLVKKETNTDIRIMVDNHPQIWWGMNFRVMKLPHRDTEKSTNVLVIDDICVDKTWQGIWKELWDLSEYIAREQCCDFIIGHLLADDGHENQVRLEEAKRKRGFVVDEKWRAVLFLSPKGEEKYRFLKSDSDEQVAYGDKIRSEWYDWMKELFSDEL